MAQIVETAGKRKRGDEPDDGPTTTKKKKKKSLESGVIVIRFELPFNIWCGGCGNHCGRGTRYNAEKSHIGSYFSTKMWNFRMQCARCTNWFEIETDPKNHDYKTGKGCFRKVETWNSKDSETIELDQSDVKEKAASDAIFKLEKGENDKKAAAENKSRLEQLLDVANSNHGDYYQMNRLLRRKFRKEKHTIAEAKAEEKRLNKHKPVRMLPPSEADSHAAAKVFDASTKRRKSVVAARATMRQRALKISSSSIFDGSKQMADGPARQEHERRKALAKKRQAMGLSRKAKVKGAKPRSNDLSTSGAVKPLIEPVPTKCTPLVDYD